MAVRLQRKPKGTYHHPDLERALVEVAIRTIREHGVEALTLRDVGAQLGVSRTALYRHFADKSALLARVASEGFRIFRQALESALASASKQGTDPLDEMGLAYIAFAQTNKSHYLTMFGEAFGSWERYPELIAEGEAAYNVLLDCVRQQQANSTLNPDYDPIHLANVIWATCHGIVTLGLSGHFKPENGHAADLSNLVQLQTQIMKASCRTSEGARR